MDLSVALAGMDRWVDDNPAQFREAQPFPHAVIDDLFRPDDLDRVLEEFPPLDDSRWDVSEDGDIQVKLRSNWQSEDDIPPDTCDIVHFLNSGAFMTRLSAMSGIERLISDPYYTGGGLNAIKRGGLLDVHCDGNWHDRMGVHRRLNAIVYLNRNWDRAWGGALELWDRDLSGPVVSIEPRFNRLVVFETHDYSYHGHPTPLSCPGGRARRSLILYYYTAAPRPSQQVLVAEPHRALWRNKGLRPLS